MSAVNTVEVMIAVHAYARAAGRTDYEAANWSSATLSGGQLQQVAGCSKSSISIKSEGPSGRSNGEGRASKTALQDVTILIQKIVTVGKTASARRNGHNRIALDGLAT